MTMSVLPNTGEAVIIDIGEGRDIHPRKKQDAGKRLARWALAIDYDLDLDCQSPTFQSLEKQDGKILLTFDHVGSGLYTFDVNRPIGFAVAGEDRQFVWADARLVGKNQVEVWSDQVQEPVAVRYAWADNPVCNLQSRQGLPATPFRTDDWPGVTIDVH
jgi:sialate O-acetylesterase